MVSRLIKLSFFLLCSHLGFAQEEYKSHTDTVSGCLCYYLDYTKGDSSFFNFGIYDTAVITKLSIPDGIFIDSILYYAHNNDSILNIRKETFVKYQLYDIPNFLSTRMINVVTNSKHISLEDKTNYVNMHNLIQLHPELYTSNVKHNSMDGVYISCHDINVRLYVVSFSNWHEKLTYLGYNIKNIKLKGDSSTTPYYYSRDSISVAYPIRVFDYKPK